MTLMLRKELVRETRDRYWRSSKKVKSVILNEFVARTGYHRIYAQAVTEALVFTWKTCDCLGSQRLHPFLPEMVRVLQSNGELCVPD